MTEKEKTVEEKKQEALEAAMGLIINAGNAKSLAFEAIRAAKTGDFETAHSKLKESDDALVEAHNAQTSMLTQEAQGHPTEVTLLTVHSQDHLMTGITFRDLAGEIVDLHERLAKLEK